MSNDRYLGQFRPEFSRLYRDRDLYWIAPLYAPLILGLVGKRFAGVSTVIDHLRGECGFRAYTLGGELRRIAEDRGVPLAHRRYLQDLGDSIRSAQGDPAFFARRVLRQIRNDRLPESSPHPPRNIVVGGFKLPEELELFRKLRGFQLVEVRMVDSTQRYQRVLANGELEAEYEADRKRVEADTGCRMTAFRHRDPDEKRAYFDELDQLHVSGHPGRWPDPFRGRPGTAIDSVPEVERTIIDNSGSLSALRKQTQRILDAHRPPQHVVHH